MKYIGEKIMFKVFITNLGKYVEGKLIGKWLDLPCNNISEALKSIDGIIMLEIMKIYIV